MKVREESEKARLDLNIQKKKNIYIYIRSQHLVPSLHANRWEKPEIVAD